MKTTTAVGTGGFLRGGRGPGEQGPGPVGHPSQHHELGPFAAPEHVAVTTHENRGFVGRESGDREVFGPHHAVGDQWRRGGAGREDHELAGVLNLAVRGEHDLALEQRNPVGKELAAHVRGEDALEVVDAVRLAQFGGGLQGIEAEVGKDADPANLFHGRAVDLFDLAHHEVEAAVVGDHDRELVDRNSFAPLHDVDANNVGADSTDPGGNEAQRTGSIGEPHAHKDVDFSLTIAGRCRSHGDQPTKWALPEYEHGVFSPDSYSWPVTQRIGVLGGTFDPVHNAHLAVAADVRDALGLDEVLLVPAGDPWQKRGQVVASAADRLALAARAVEGIDGVSVSAVEVDREGASVTADTLEALQAPDRTLFLILGADAVANMGTWRRLEDTRHLADVVVVERAGDLEVWPPGEGWRVHHVPIPRLDISSTDLRERLASGRPVVGLMPPAVVKEIHQRGLYTGD